MIISTNESHRWKMQTHIIGSCEANEMNTITEGSTHPLDCLFIYLSVYSFNICVVFICPGKIGLATNNRGQRSWHTSFLEEILS